MALTLFIVRFPNVDSFFMICSAVIHELGHITASRLLRIRIKAFSCGICGGDITLNSSPSYAADVAVYLSGIAANLLFAFIFRSSAFCGHNCAYALLNALPIAELDGGRALRALLLQRLDYTLAKRVCEVISYVTLFFTWQLGIYLFFKTTSNITLLLLCVYLFTEAKGEWVISPRNSCRDT